MIAKRQQPLYLRPLLRLSLPGRNNQAATVFFFFVIALLSANTYYIAKPGCGYGHFAQQLLITRVFDSCACSIVSPSLNNNNNNNTYNSNYYYYYYLPD
jgi:hypothetical protein